MWYDGRSSTAEEQPSTAEITTLGALPAELQNIVLDNLDAASLASSAGCCTLWRAAVPRLARDRLCSGNFRLDATDSPGPVRALRGAEWLAGVLGNRPNDGLPLRCTACSDWIAPTLDKETSCSSCGHTQAGREASSWRDEWPELRLRQALLLAASKGPERVATFTQQIVQMGGEDAAKAHFCSGGRFCIDADLDGPYKCTIDWKLSAGWERSDAEAVSLLSSRGAAALASAIWHGHEWAAIVRCVSERHPNRLVRAGAVGRSTAPARTTAHELSERVSASYRQPSLARSAWTLNAALWARGWREAHDGLVAPRCYAHLDGEFGLAMEDGTWRDLVRAATGDGGAGIGGGGAAITTRGFACAMAANLNSFPEPSRGYCMPVTLHSAGTQYVFGESDHPSLPPVVTLCPRGRYELVDSDLVCFVSATAGNGVRPAPAAPSHSTSCSQPLHNLAAGSTLCSQPALCRRNN